jgi:hypothetical protein
MAAEVHRAIGGAGTGKTRLILDRLSEARDDLGLATDEIGFTTFTRAGRAEIAERAADAWGVSSDDLTKGGWFRTAHSIAHRCCRVEEGQLLQGQDGDEWLSGAVGGKVHTRTDARGERTYVADGDDTIPLAMKAWELARSRMESLDATLRRWMTMGEACPEQQAAASIVRRYELAKVREGRLDFTDMIARFAGVKFTLEGPVSIDPVGDAPEHLRVLAVDEAQDSSQLVDRVCRRLASSGRIERVWLCGDPYQCQPAGTPVLTLSGYKNIEDLDPSADQLVAFSRKDGRFYGAAGFEIASRDVDSSSLIEITLSDGTKHISTDTHKWVARTRGKKDAFAVYVMSRGGRWRVGTVQMFAGKPDKKNGSFRLKMRMNQEDASRAWVLKVFETDREARCYEQIVSCKYGIPQVTFRPVSGGRSNLDEGYIEKVFDTLGDLTKNGRLCLVDHGLSESNALCEKADRCKNGGQASRLVHASNLLPGIHLVPKMNDQACGISKRRCEWVEIVSCRRLPAGETVRVWSMNVHKHHTYVTTGGIVTGNSIHSFAGGDYNLFLAWKAEEYTMPQSYRCPSEILALGERCLRQMHRGYRDRGILPAAPGGRISSAASAQEAISRINADSSVLILGRCTFSLEDYEAELKARRLPYQWVDKGHAAVQLSGYGSLWSLQHGQACLGESLANAVGMISVKNKYGSLLTRGAKAEWKDGRKSHLDIVRPTDGDYELAGFEPTLRELIRSGKWVEALEPRYQERASMWHGVASQHGEELANSPPIRLSTIHSAKGLEADDVVLSSITSPSIERGRETLSEIHDEECRVAYVAVTRAKRSVTFVEDGFRCRMELPL